MRSRPIKVLHILHAFSHGGLENGIANIINGSPPNIEHELCLLTTAGEFIRRLKKPVRYYELHKKPGNSLKIILQIRQIIRKSCADIVHTRNWGAFDGVFAAGFCPGVTLIHGEHGRDITDPYGLNRRRNMTRRIFSPRIRKFTAVSLDLAGWLHKEVGIPQEKIILIRNGVDTERFRPHRDEELRRELGISNDEFVIGTIGRLDPIKNHGGLIQAYTGLAADHTNARLVIAGDGPERKNLEAMAAQVIGMKPPIITGYRSDVERFYGVFDLFVLNSFAEGMSNSLLEAMASEIPVACAPASANWEILAGGERGYILKEHTVEALIEALLCAMRQPDELHLLAECARLFVKQHHSLYRMISEYIALYESVSKGQAH